MSTKSKIIHIIVGSIILAPAIAFIMLSNLGLDPLGCLVDSLSQLTYSVNKGTVFITYGTMLTCVNVCFLTFHFIRKRNPMFVIFGLLMSIGLGLGIDGMCLLLANVPNDVWVLRILWFLIGFILMCIGIAIIQKGRIQKMPFEGFQEALSEIVKKDINVVRVYVEIVLEILAVIFYIVVLLAVNNPSFNIFNTVYFGTIFIMLLTGPTVNLIYKKILKGDVSNEQVN